MACGAIGLKEFLSLARIAAGLASEPAVCLAIRPAIRGKLHLQLDELRNIVNVVLRETRKRGHSRLRTAVLDEPADFLILLVMQDHD
jgi:hypothetical protein